MVLKTVSRICSSVWRFTTAKRAISCILSANWYSAEYGGTTFHAAITPMTKIVVTMIAFNLPSPRCARCPRMCFSVEDNCPLLLCLFTDSFYMPKLAPRPLPVDTSSGQVFLGANPVLRTAPPIEVQVLNLVGSRKDRSFLGFCTAIHTFSARHAPAATQHIRCIDRNAPH